MAKRLRRKRGAIPSGRLSLENYRRFGLFTTLLGQLRGRWQDLIDGAWFIPGLVALLGFLLAILTVALDRLLGPGTLPFGFHGGAATARSLLSTIVGGLLTVVGLVISITIVTLQLVSSQFTSRALRSLMSDRIIQVVTGCLLGIFAYCLFVLVMIRDPGAGDSKLFIPSISITLALILTFVVMLLLFIFVGHTMHSLQVSYLAARLAHQTLVSIEHPYPGWGRKSITILDDQAVNAERTALVRSWYEQQEPTRISSTTTGYIQTISLTYLAKLMCLLGLRVSLLVCPGDFVTPETVLAEVWSDVELDNQTIDAFLSCISIARERDIDQDTGYGVRQIADIALRALSPAVNDPTTGVLCIGYLQAIFERMGRKYSPCAIKRLDGEDCVLVARYFTLQEYFELLVEISRYASSNARVVLALLDALVHIARAMAARKRPFALIPPIVDAVAAPALAEARTDLDRSILTENLQSAHQIITSLESGKQ